MAKGCHVFMEKSFAVDAPGIRRVLKAGEEATKKNLKIASGLRCRHDLGLEEAVKQIHGGGLGEVITLWAYREHDPVGFTPKSPGESELAHQIRNYSNFTWLNGSFMLDWLIHNIDICCWIKQGWPVSAQGHGGRQVRTAPDQLFDHYSVEFTFADGTRMQAQGRHMANCWGFFGVVVHGAKGSAILGEGQAQPRIYKSHRQTPDNLIWQHKGPEPNAYQVEHDVLFDAIRQDKPYNETDFSVKARHSRHPRPHGRRIGQDDHLGRSPGLEPRTGSRARPVHDGLAIRQRCPTPKVVTPLPCRARPRCCESKSLVLRWDGSCTAIP